MRRTKTLRERFHAKVNYDGPGGCWLWMGSRLPFGHGRIQAGPRGGGVLLAHRVAYEMADGPIPDGMCVLHMCDVPACVRPTHLRLGSRADNTADMMSKGRHAKVGARGSANGSARLTAAHVLEIRQLFGSTPGVDIAARFGVSRSLVSSIGHGRIWRHLTPETT